MNITINTTPGGFQVSLDGVDVKTLSDILSVLKEKENEKSNTTNLLPPREESSGQ